jgi:hypothetical protein
LPLSEAAWAAKRPVHSSRENSGPEVISMFASGFWACMFVAIVVAAPRPISVESNQPPAPRPVNVRPADRQIAEGIQFDAPLSPAPHHQPRLFR